MFVVEKPGAFINGIFANRESASGFLKQVPKAEKLKLRQIREVQHYPFFIVEQKRGEFKFFQYRKDIKTKKYGTLYTITADWNSQPGVDEMGKLNHDHSDEEGVE